MAKHPAGDPPVYQLKITLQGSDPQIWRRLLVPGDIWLGRLHDIIQAAMGWRDEYLHAFDTADSRYCLTHPDRDARYEPDGLPEGFDPAGLLDEAAVQLREVLSDEHTALTYTYDLRGGMCCEVSFETAQPGEASGELPRVLGGERAAPPEGVGGLSQYQNVVLEALRDPEHPQHARWREWVEEDFDPEAFDFESADRRVRVLRRFSRLDQNLIDDVLAIGADDGDALREDLVSVLRRMIQAIEDLPDGYTLRFTGGPLFAQMVSFFVSLAYHEDQQMRLQVDIAPASGPIALTVTGDGARAFVRSTFRIR